MGLKDADRFAAGDIVEIPIGRIRLTRRQPEGLGAADGKAADWFGESLSEDIQPGSTLITPAGRVFVTVHARPAGASKDARELPDEIESGVLPTAANSSLTVNTSSSRPVTAKDEEELAKDVQAAREYAVHSRAENTFKAYENDWRIFRDWCRRAGLCPLPCSAETAAVFAAGQARKGLKPPTIGRRLAAIRFFHLAHELPAPQGLPGMQLSSVMAGIRRRKSVKPVRKKALLPDDLKKVLAVIDLGALKGIRDYALLLLGFAGAFRRSELADLHVRDLTFLDDGLSVEIRRSKRDQEGRGRRVPIPRAGGRICPVAAVTDWISEADITSGPLFRRLSKTSRVLDKGIGPEHVRVLLKDHAAAAGLNAAEIGAHSLRRGWMTAASLRMVDSGAVDLKALMDQAGHRNERTALGYIEEAEDFKRHPGRELLG